MRGRFADLGYFEGRSLAIEYRYGNDREAQLLGDLRRDAKIETPHCFRNILRKNAENTATNDTTGVKLG